MIGGVELIEKQLFQQLNNVAFNLIIIFKIFGIWTC